MNSDPFIQSLRELCSIESVAGIEVCEDAPYGKSCAEALDYVINLCRDFGFETKICEHHRAGWAQIGEGDEIVGILTHLDVVPAGNGWDYPAYGLTEVGDRIYGRGVTDDKGPAMACIYAMKDLLDSGAPLGKRVRIIFGQSEESGVWEDMEYYKLHEEIPGFGFTPDADFPAIYGEKRILCLELSMPLEESGLLSLCGGNAGNMVADRCTAVYCIDGKEVTADAEGKAAHASTPEDGVNAITILMSKLEKDLPDSRFVEFYNRFIGDGIYGERMGCALEDPQSGKLTLNAGVVSTQDGNIVLTLDIREPVTFADTAVLDTVCKAAGEYGMTVSVTENTAPVYMDKNGPVISKLLEVYRSETKDYSEPEVIGGGTYARAMDNIVAFGPMLPGRELTEHQKNEYILKEDLMLLRKIYCSAIKALAE